MPSINPSVTVQAANVRAQNLVEKTDNAQKAKITHIAVDLDNAPGKTAGTGEASPKAHPAEVRKNLKRVLDSLPLDLSAILAVVRKNAQEIRKANVLVRDMGLQAQFNELNKSADDMQTAANFRGFAGLVQSTVQLGMAGVQIHSSVQAGKLAAEGIEPQKQGQELQQQAADLNATATQFESQAQAARAAPAAATHDTAVADEQLTTAIEKKLEAQDQAISDQGLEAMQAAEVEQNVGSKEQPGIPEAAPRTPEQLEKDAGILRKQADDKQAQADVKLEQVKDINARADGIRSKWDARSKILDELVGLLTTSLKSGAENADIHSKRHEVNAKQHESESSRANDAIQNATEIGRDALQKLDSVEQVRNETQRAIRRNMG